MIPFQHPIVTHLTHLLTRPTPWIGCVIAIGLADLLLPAQYHLFVIHVALLMIAWQLLHRRYINLLTALMFLATVVPPAVIGIRAFAEHNATPDSRPPVSQPKASPSTDISNGSDLAKRLEPARLWTLVTLASASLFHVNFQRSRRRRLGLRRELQRNVRQRTSQLQKVNVALRNEVARREATEHLLDRSETNFQSLTDRMQLQVLRKDTAGVITYANDTFCQQIGLRPSQVIGCTDTDIYPHELAAAYQADDMRVMATGRAVEHVEQHPALDGETGYVQVFKAPEYDHRGVCTGIQVVFWDVTQKHRSEIALRNSEARKRALFESAGDAVLLVDHQHRIVEANPSATQLFNASEWELSQRRLEDIATPLNSRPAIADGVPTGLAVRPGREPLAWDTLPKSQRCEVTIVRDDSTVFESEVSLHPVPIGQAEGLAIVLRDVTLRRQAFDALRDAKAAAEAASRTKSEFMAGVSHELRTPLGGIIGLSDLLANTTLSDRGRQYVDMIRHSASLLGDFIEDILDFAAIEAGRLQINLTEVDLHAVVGDAFKSLAARAIDKPLSLIFSIDPRTPRHVISDAKRLRQIVLNLAGNALKFTLDGEVHVRLSVATDEAANLTMGRSKQPRECLVLLDVIDTGIGIPLDKQKRVFDAFERGEASTTQRFGGTGLGLSISNGLVERLQGSIELESRVDVGSQFRCRFPMQVVETASEIESVLIPDESILGINNATQQLALREMLSELAMKVLRQPPHRAPNSRRPIVWLLSPHTSLANALPEHRRPNDIVIWILRLGQATPPVAAPTDRSLVEPVLPMELLQAISGTSEPSPTANQPLHPIGKPLGDANALRLLVVDDSDVNRVLIHDQLAHVGFDVDVANDGTEAISKVSTRDYECILMDLQMPDMDGIEATRQIREQLTQSGRRMPPVIALTAHVTREHRQQCLEAGLDDFLTKPVDRKILESTVQHWISGMEQTDTVAERGETDAVADSVTELTTPSLPPAVPDWQVKVNRLAGNDPETIRSVCEAFLEEVPQLMRQLRQAVTAADSAKARRAAHTLKSCLRHVAEDAEIETVATIENNSLDLTSVKPEDLEELARLTGKWLDRVRAYRESLTLSVD